MANEEENKGVSNYLDAILVSCDDIVCFDTLNNTHVESRHERLIKKIYENKYAFNKILELKSRYKIDSFTFMIKSGGQKKHLIEHRENDILIEVVIEGHFYILGFYPFTEEKSEQAIKNRILKNIEKETCFIAYSSTRGKTELEMINNLIIEVDPTGNQ